VIRVGDDHRQLPSQDWDALVNRDDLSDHLARLAENAPKLDVPASGELPELQAPIGTQEVWGSGVTYHRSRDARMEESEDAGGGDFYSRVYDAPRPELFFKATPHRVVASGQPVRIRADSKWNVPEPELTLLVTSSGAIVGYTVGNDMSSRDIEGENPLYLPQAKTFDGCCAIGPGILVTRDPLPPETAIELTILRGGKTAIEGRTALAQMKRKLPDLVGYLTRESSFPTGCLLLTGTGIVPEGDFTLLEGDEIRIRIGPIGTLVNPVAGGRGPTA
jgi:2-dehydro-3-deoxy-D-arabinonate dehydratase